MPAQRKGSHPSRRRLPLKGIVTRSAMSAPMRAWRNGHSTPPPTLVEHWKERLARLEAEAATLRAGEERYRQLVESSDDWVWEVDEHWRYTYSSPRCLELLGC